MLKISESTLESCFNTTRMEDDFPRNLKRLNERISALECLINLKGKLIDNTFDNDEQEIKKY